MDSILGLEKVKHNNVIDNQKNVQKVSKEFEELFLQQLLKSGLKDVDIVGSSSAGSDIVKDLYLEGIAKASSGNMGISQMIVEHLSNKK